MLEETICVSWLEGEISLWCIRAFYLPGPPPQLCKPHSPPATTDAHLMGEELVQPQAWEGQERGREKHGKEGKWRKTTRLTPASPSLSTPAAARPASAEPWLVSDGGTEGGGCTPEVSQEHSESQSCPKGDLLPGHRLVPPQGQRRRWQRRTSPWQPGSQLHCSSPSLWDEPWPINNPSTDGQGWAAGSLQGGW